VRVVFVTHYSDLYGANRSLLCLIDALSKTDVDPFVVAPQEGGLTDALSDRGVSYLTLPFKMWMSPPKLRWKGGGRFAVNVLLAPVLALYLFRWDPDLIHTNSSATPFGALVAEVLNLPHVWHVREFGDLDYGFVYDLGSSVFRWFLNRADHLLAVSDAIRQHVLADVDTPTKVIYNGVVSEDRLLELRETARNTTDAPWKDEGVFTFAILGRIRDSKGQAQAVRAVHRLAEHDRSVRLLIAGEGERSSTKKLHRLCHELGIEDRVSFLGYVAEPFDVYRSADAVLMCSSHEAMGRVTVEAMAAMRPVIGRDAAGTSELVDHEVSGLLYDGSAADLANSMLCLMDNRDFARRLGETGWERVREKYTSETYARRVHQVFRHVAER
jgi:glycosyltransferase involved in cell wall biosynthesis